MGGADIADIDHVIRAAVLVIFPNPTQEARRVLAYVRPAADVPADVLQEGPKPARVRTQAGTITGSRTARAARPARDGKGDAGTVPSFTGPATGPTFLSGMAADTGDSLGGPADTAPGEVLLASAFPKTPIPLVKPGQSQNRQEFPAPAAPEAEAPPATMPGVTGMAPPSPEGAATGGGTDSAAAGAEAGWRRIARPADILAVEQALGLYASLNANAAQKRYFDLQQKNFVTIIGLSDRKLSAQQVIGDWYCRSIKVVRDAVFGFPYLNCRISRKDGRLFFEKLNGSQRRSGFLYEDDGKRLVFLGGMAYGEADPPAYGAGPNQSIAGVLVGGSGGQLLMIFPEVDSYELFELVK